MEHRLRWGLVLLLTAAVPACGPHATDSELPNGAPVGLTITPVSTARIDLEWTDTSTNEAGFRIERSTDGINFTVVAHVGLNVVSYNDFNLLAAQLYSYRVVAWTDVGDSAPTPTGTATTPALTWSGPITGGPVGRTGHSAVYDSLGQRMIVFGGAAPGLRSDLWELSLSAGTPAWAPLTAAAGPAPTGRTGHSAIYDSANNRMIVFGGQAATGFSSEVWILDLTSPPVWSLATVTGTPAAGRRSHSAVYDSLRGRMIVFGGSSPSPYKDVQVLSLPSSGPLHWSSPITGFVGPTERDLHAAAYDEAGDRMIVFAGYDGLMDPDGTPLTAETWSLPGTGVWTPMLFPGTPPSRQAHTLIYDRFNERIVVHSGGDILSEPILDMWSLNLHGVPAWTLLSSSAGPAQGRYGHTAIYDVLYKRMVIFGGEDGVGTYFDEAWVLGL